MEGRHFNFIILTMQLVTIATTNCHGQSKLNISKQVFIQNFLLSNNIDILLCKETKIEEGCFSQCNKYTIIKNNSRNDFGTSVIIKNDIHVKDVKFYTEGRVIVFNTENTTIVNAYPKAGRDAESRKEREDFLLQLSPTCSNIQNRI